MIIFDTSDAESEAETELLVASGIVKVLGEGEGQVRVLKGVDLSLRPGELTLMMGPSGSGKTTLLSILGCIMTPTSGRLTVAGRPTDGLSPDELAAVRRDNIGLVFQSYNLFPTMTALENVALALDVKGIYGSEAWDLAAEALDAVGLSAKAASFPSRLSGGQKQRVAIARAMAGAPAVLLADEPTAALDAENGRSVMELMARLARDKSRTVLAVTHDHRTLPYADRVILIEDGLIVSDEMKVRGEAGHEEGAIDDHG